jgi:hypothetical protein
MMMVEHELRHGREEKVAELTRDQERGSFLISSNRCWMVAPEPDVV